MPKREDIRKILMIGAGPIVIGQAAEFDYSGSQALKALLEEGYEMVVVNSNPATIMTDPDWKANVYIEPLTVESLEKIISKERPDALLPTMGGQTGLNLAMDLHRNGILKRHNVELIGASPKAIETAEDRQAFRSLMNELQIPVPQSAVVGSVKEAVSLLEKNSKERPKLSLPVILRPSYTLGGEGGGQATDREEFEQKVKKALNASPVHQVLIEESLLGWQEFELELIRDAADNVIVVCGIENIDPMGVHTGDSITVAPCQTLSDVDFQRMRDEAIAIIRGVGVDTGGSNVQFAYHPQDGRIAAIEMNPRVSRSSALASKATGYPIAKIAAKLAVGYHLHELQNEITGVSSACFEPSIDYVVVKTPRFNFEKFPQSEPLLSTFMKSVGENMALGRSFSEAFLKSLAGNETTDSFFYHQAFSELSDEGLQALLRLHHFKRIFAVREAFFRGMEVKELAEITGIHPWFLNEFKSLSDVQKKLQEYKKEFSQDDLFELKKLGFTDKEIAYWTNQSESDVRGLRNELGVYPVYKRVDSCAAEFEARTPYLYSSYDQEDESPDSLEKSPESLKRVMILGGGPNRIGQGIEFDYCCVHACFALKEKNIETVMVNCNPETVSTDWDTSDILLFDPVDAERVIHAAKKFQVDGVILQFGGQTPLKLARELEAAEIKVLGTAPDKIDLCEDRERFGDLVQELGLLQPAHGMARSPEQTLEVAEEIGYPVLVRPSYVLGGQFMRILYSKEALQEYLESRDELFQEDGLLLVDKFLDRAVEVDVDALADGENVLIGGVMEHIEEAGVHSGDSMSSIPPYSLSKGTLEEIKMQTRQLGRALGVLGLMNIQFAVTPDQKIWVIEVNPRASRTVPFIAKATGVPLAKVASDLMIGGRLKDLGLTEDLDRELKEFFVKGVVLPFGRFEKVDTILGPEMKSTGEVMGRAKNFSEAFYKALVSSTQRLPEKGKVFLSVRNEDKAGIVPVAEKLSTLGFDLVATQGTSQFFSEQGLKCESVNKVAQGSPHCVDAILAGDYQLVINTTSDEQAVRDSFSIRRSALEAAIPTITTLAAARLLPGALEIHRSKRFDVQVLGSSKIPTSQN
jgi:carbamoyl-phosphate synthase large subunit